MLKIPILRQGMPYFSLEEKSLLDHRNGKILAKVSQANTGLILRDLKQYQKSWGRLQEFSTEEILSCLEKASAIFLEDTLPIGKAEEEEQSPEDFLAMQSATTAMPIVMCRRNMDKVGRVLSEMKTVLASLTSGLPFEVLNQGYGEHQGKTVSYFPVGKSFSAILPNNSPGVHGLWLPVLALRVPLALRPGTQEPWTPLRLCWALQKAGIPLSALGFYPCDYSGANSLLTNCDRGMIFGDGNTVKRWSKNSHVEVHGPGMSKILIGEDVVEDWPLYLDLMVRSIAENSGRSCINASSIWTPKYGEEIAEELAKRLAQIEAKALDHPEAPLAAFSNPKIAQAIDKSIAQGLKKPGAFDLTARFRSSERIVHIGRSTFLQPTLIYCPDIKHPLAEKEFLFPYASVLEMSNEKMLQRLPRTLVVTAITKDLNFEKELLEHSRIDRLNIGAIPTCQIGWGEPHEGNLFQLLYRQRAFQKA